MDSLVNRVSESTHMDQHWLMLADSQNETSAAAARRLVQRLDQALEQLGRIDYQLTNALSSLADEPETDSYDNLHCHVAQCVEPGIRNAFKLLVAEVSKAKTVATSVLTDSGGDGN